ncbi:Hypothetical protein PHPALM_19645 [Phytophthora palmivora]|uniref:Uncharacterized protein n=1 Tax=Phytophthora palmivora TaxID=4796 RepID=A0A2P4XGY3_9STRA|nr:Hypothetical protein PHPALM_19645 [Phytophthora palmivora]
MLKFPRSTRLTSGRGKKDNIGALERARTTPPSSRPNLVASVDYDQVHFWSNPAVLGKYNLPNFVLLLRGQTSSNLRPNKDTYDIPLPMDSVMAPTVAKWNDIVRYGVQPQWCHTLPSTVTRLCNQGMFSRICRHQRAGQLEGRYLIENARLVDQWPQMSVIPLGAVSKTGSTTSYIRLINVYSIPHSASVNDYTIGEDFPSISHNPPRDITKQIHHLTSFHIR